MPLGSYYLSNARRTGEDEAMINLDAGMLYLKGEVFNDVLEIVRVDCLCMIQPRRDIGFGGWLRRFGLCLRRIV